MKMLLLFLATCGKILSNADNNNTATNYRQMIRNALMEKYDRFSGPVPAGNINGAGPLNVSIVPNLFSILDVNVAQQTLTLQQWMEMFWIDPDLQWDPALYGGVNKIMVQRSTIWLPDIVVMRRISMTALSDKLSLATVFSNGTIYYSSDQVVTMTCGFDVVNFPYDTQNCSIEYVSWMYAADQIILSPYGTPDFTDYIENDEWTLRSYTHRPYLDEGFSALKFDLLITRKPNYYITTFVWPIFIINCLSIIGIFSPFNESGEREEKVTMGLTSLLTMAVILMIIAGDMPRTAELPLLAVFIMVEIGLASLASVVSVFVVHLHGSWMNGTPVPNWAVQNKDDEEQESKRDQQQMPTFTNGVQKIYPRMHMRENKSEDLREKWSKVAGRLDLMLMLIFLAANIITCICLLTIGNSKLNQ